MAQRIDGSFEVPLSSPTPFYGEEPLPIQFLSVGLSAHACYRTIVVMKNIIVIQPVNFKGRKESTRSTRVEVRQALQGVYPGSGANDVGRTARWN